MYMGAILAFSVTEWELDENVAACSWKEESTQNFFYHGGVPAGR